MQSVNKASPLKSYSVWDLTTRLFHWVNFLSVLSLIVFGVIILNSKTLGVSGDAKILLKTIHTFIGYVFVLNLVIRLIWGFFGNKFVRWKEVLPYGKGYWKSLTAYIAGLIKGSPPSYLGHNPIARLVVSAFLLLLSAQAVTGLVLAGTDLYLPPFGHEIAEWVTDAGEDHSKLEGLEPGSKEKVVEEKYAEMREFREPFISLHIIVFYALLFLILIHILGVVITENTEKSGLISAMFTGNKVFSEKPVDLNE